MHEYSIVSALVERAESEARAHHARRIDRLHVRIGALSGVDPQLLMTAFTLFQSGALLRDTELVLRKVEASWKCGACGAPIARGSVLRCPRCASPARLTEGDEIVLDRIEMEVSDV
jgi:hydrogenase nickel incorporation protein HypA/HybF